MSKAIKLRKYGNGYTPMGDPGLLSSLGAAGGALLRGEGITGAISAGAQELGLLPANQTMGPQVLPPARGGFSRTTGRVMPGELEVSLPGGIGLGLQSPGFEVGHEQGQVTNGRMIGMEPACPSGYRPNKTGYFVKGADGGGARYVPPRSKCVKIRRRNPLNPRALDRAMSRMTSAKRAAKKIGRITIRKKC